MKNMNEFEIDPYRAAMIFSHFEKIHARLIDGELDFGEGDAEMVDIGDPYDHSIRASLGYLVDSKYGMHLSWCSLNTLVSGEIQRYIATVDRAIDNGEKVHDLVVERCDEIIYGKFYCHHSSFNQELHPDTIISHLILKDLEEYPSVRRCDH